MLFKLIKYKVKYFIDILLLEWMKIAAFSKYA